MAPGVSARLLIKCAGVRPSRLYGVGKVHNTHMLVVAVRSVCRFTTAPLCAGALEAWPARTTWRSLRWWARRHGLRSVPVELGSGRAWREAVLTLRELVEGHLAPSARGAPGVETAYLAQHALLDQACFPRQAGDGVGASVCMCPPEYQKKHACNGQPTRSIDALLRVHEGEALQNGSS
jgi:hypothetical protein